MLIKSNQRFLIGLFLFFLCLYLGMTLMYVNNPLSHTDSNTYYLNALNFTETFSLYEYWDPTLKAWRPHGYSILLAALMTLFGKSPMIGVYWNALALSLNALLICWMANKISGKIASIVAVLFLSSQVGFYLHAVVLLPECTFMLFLTLSLFFVLFFENRLRGIFLSGLSLGVASFFKTNVFHLPLSLACLFFVVAIFNFFLKRESLLKSAKLLAIWVLGFTLGVGPYLFRNYITIGKADRIVSYSGYNLFLGNISLKYKDILRPAHSDYYPDLNNLHAKLQTDLKNEVLIDDALKKEAAIIIKDNLGLFLHKTVRQFILLFGPEVASYELGKWPDRLMKVSHQLIFIFGFLGGMLCLFKRKDFFSVLLTANYLHLMLLISVMFLMNRFKEPVTSILILPASLLLAELINYLRKRLYTST